ncbi:MAG: alpha-L-rhamnosidase C-terminal domain-containing protein, partial [Terracidiphilus sp.]
IDTMPSDPGFHTIVLHPVFDARLGHLAFDYDSSYGPIHSDWTVNGSEATWHVTIPANTTGWWPLSQKAAARYQRNPRVKSSTRDGQNGLELAPGSYTFQVALE